VLPVVLLAGYVLFQDLLGVAAWLLLSTLAIKSCPITLRRYNPIRLRELGDRRAGGLMDQIQGRRPA
jgi:hypothetical protein